MSLGRIFLSEFLGIVFLILLGVDVVATDLLIKPKGKSTGWLMINFGWGLAVFTGVYVVYGTGGHLSPAVTSGLWAAGKTEFVPGVPVDVATVCTYIVAQFLGAFVGAILAWLAYEKHYGEHENPAEILGTFSTGPEIRSYGWNLITKAITTFVLAAWVLISGGTKTAMGPLTVALIIVAVGASLGGPTGYAINQARDLGPHVAHAILSIKNKGGSDRAYAWVPVVGPTVGGILADLVFDKFDIMGMIPPFPS